MRFMTTALMFLAIAASPVSAADTEAGKRYKALLDEFDKEGGARLFAKRFLKIAEEHPDDPVAVDALVWVVENVRGRRDTTRSLELLTKNHVQSKKLGAACGAIARARSVASETLLRAVLQKNPDQKVRAQACYYLAALLDLEAGLLEQIKAQPELAPRVLQYYGKTYGAHLSSLDRAKLAKKRIQIYEQMRARFASEPRDDSTLGKIAERALFAIKNLSVGCVAPEIEGEDIHGKRFKLSDYRGKVVLLTFWGHW